MRKLGHLYMNKYDNLSLEELDKELIRLKDLLDEAAVKAKEMLQ
ncbi:MAG: hypothetical protein P4L49_18060 [Desulfosporosinus sp.]|nr:hypothetical protein [Desulfosporosinus sp.]